MDAKAEAASLKTDPLPAEDGAAPLLVPPIPELTVDYTQADDDMVLTSIYEIDQHTKDLQAEIQRLQQQKAVLLIRALEGNIRQDRFSELREIPGKKFRVVDAERMMADWPQMCKEAAEIEYRRLKDKVSKDGPTLKTLETVMGKARVDQYCTIKQGPSAYEVIPLGRY